MPYSIYTKPFYDENQLITFLHAKFLPINDEVYAKKILKDITYYRFKSYLHPFEDQDDKIFDGSKSFEEIEKLYRFDDELRDVLFSIIGRIEVKLRSKLNYTITKFTDDSFWYLNRSFFSNNHDQILNRISNAYIKSSDEYVTHFKRKYINDKNDTYKHLPPFWITAELLMFGETISFFNSLKKNQFIISDDNNALDMLAKEFGAYNLKELNSWLFFMKIIRNRCAHHSRVWNVNYSAPQGIVNLNPDYNRLTIDPSNHNRIYSFFAILHIITQTLDMNINMKDTIDSLMEKYPIFEELKDSAGFPTNWDTDIFWT